MGSAEYRILEYARSENVIRGVDFLVVLRLPNATGPCLRAYLWDGWKTVIDSATDNAIEYLEAVLYDVRQNLVADRSPMSGGFFDAIDDLNIGPLRTSAAGSFQFEESNQLPSSFPDRAGELTLLSRDGITSMIEFIIDSDSQPHAARS
jgi:hypothetical protein